MDDAFVFLLVVGLLVLIAAAILCSWDMRRMYGRSLMKSLLWDRLMDSQRRTAIAGAILGPIGVYSLLRPWFGLAPIQQPWGAVALVLSLYLLFWGSIADWLTLRAIRRGKIASPSTPPRDEDIPFV